MKTRFLVTAILAISAVPNMAHAQTAPAANQIYSHSELMRLIRTAHTPDEFNALADYFDRKHEQNTQKAKDEQTELNRRLAAPYLSPKYPTPVDTARRRLQYYKAEAEEYEHRADTYRQKAKEMSGTTHSPDSH
jgi:hypothetical protein